MSNSCFSCSPAWFCEQGNVETIGDLSSRCSVEGRGDLSLRGIPGTHL